MPSVSREPSSAEVAHALVGFYEGARAHARGALLTDNKTIGIGLRKIADALKIIDGSDGGRDILIPFLTHQDAMVRFEAAQALHATRRELATLVLLDLALTCCTEAGGSANLFLTFAGEPRGADALAEYPA